MPVAGVYDIENNRVAEIELSEAVFGAPVNEDVIYEVVRMQMASRRSGTASTKGRSDVSGSNKKPWRQKGTGRARVGNSRSPIWRGGGIIFGPTPHGYAFRVPKKVRRLALISALSMKFKEERMTILRDFPMEEIKTKRFQEVIDRFGFKKTLFVIDQKRPVLEKSSRNIRDVKMVRSEGVNVYDLLKYDHVVLLEPSVHKIEGALIA
ncbi:MAG: 50S ribosomal protein L4 [Proteobacteria bacterium]|jgi:large subunit ribosomal protein L4|nr:50S ribosomal protein L4 [Pseudomonadota bacterium]MCG2740465.1 50S ribosomal protein L4 [Syntrophaceae bacterium]MDO9229323.1 50S ribosomal protein L4 [Syntrophales bacterium]MBU1745397.1 50S ribosomal protein L4 [Pseudomonadota bacterium]MBU1964941.1 50S ribosomal protein L4 [Pseudomonadota bacterium]